MNKIKLVISSAYAATTTIIFVTVITIWAELFAPLKEWLKDFSGHHWTSKSILSVLLYVIVTIVLYWTIHDQNETRIRKALIVLLIFLVLGSIIITAFYTGHHFKFF